MLVTAIRQQERRKERFSVYVDGKYSFSLSDSALLQSGLSSGVQLSGDDIKRYKRLSAEDKLFTNAVRYAAMRQRSRWEIMTYLARKEAAPELAEQIAERLGGLGFVNDKAFARNWVENRHLLKPTSKRKLRQELQAKRVATTVIDEVLREDETGDRQELRSLIAKKRRLPKFKQDQAKLMQYLARQGFGYDDIKSAMDESEDD